MAGQKLSAKATETVEYLEALLKETAHFGALVEQFAAAKKGADMYSTQLSRELGRLRQKAMIRNLGFIADAAGQLGVMASRGGSAIMKSRMLRDGVASFNALVERTIKATIVADQNEQKEKAYVAEKEKKAEAEHMAEHIRARLLAEEAAEAAKRAAAAVQPAAAKPAASPASGSPARPAPGPAPQAKPGSGPPPGSPGKPAAPVPPRPGAPAPPRPGAPATSGPAAPVPPRPAAPAPAPGQPKAAEPPTEPRK